VIVRHSRSPNFDPGLSLPDELARLGLFEIHGEHQVTPVTFSQTCRDYVEQFHSTASLAREVMPIGEAARFDEEVMHLVRDHADDGVLRMHVGASLVWGRPLSPPHD
jgi:hypothetical protein